MAFEKAHSSTPSSLHSSTNSHAHMHGQSNLSGSRVEKQLSSASGSDARLALNFGSNSPHPQTRIPQGTRPLTRHVTLVMVDSANAISSEKDRDRPVSGGRAIAAQAAKEKIQVERKVHAFASSMWGSVTLLVTPSLRLRGNHTVSASATQAQQDGVVIISCDAPFHLVRELGSVITRLCSSSQLSHHQSPLLGGPTPSLLGAFCSSTAAAPYKRFLKAVAAELSYAPTPLHQHQQFKATSSSSSSSSSSAAMTAGAVGAQTASQSQAPSQSQTPSTHTPLRNAFIYSVTDDKFDFISYSPSILSRGI